MNNVKCLFGYHKYDEKWKVKVDTGIVWHESMVRNIYICSTCRKSLKYIYTPCLGKEFTLFEVVSEYDDRFIIRNKFSGFVVMMKCKRL